MKIEKLNHSKFKVLLYTLILGVILIFIIVFQTSRASYRTTQSINIAHGTINYKMPDLNILALKVQKDTTSTDESNYDSADSIPTGSYELNTTKSYCTYSNNGEATNINTNMSYDSETGIVTLDITKKGTKCYLYFDIKTGKTITEILSAKTKTASRSITEPVTTYDSTKIYYDTDNDGTTYYYAGAVTDNWVKFADMYWRIIRVNGDGSIRMIYTGDSEPSSNLPTGTSTQIESAGGYSHVDASGSSPYPYVKGNSYVGYMRGINTSTDSTSSYSAAHANTYSSNAKTKLENWYATNIVIAGYDNFIDYDAYFCNDRTSTTDGNATSISSNSGGYGTTVTYYGAYTRLIKASPRTPTFRCPQANDTLRYKSSTSSASGSKVLEYPVGLITADEVIFAGGYSGSENQSYYLYTGKTYWTMSPSLCNGSNSDVFIVKLDGSANGYYSCGDSGIGLRPVINLKAGTKFTGSGTYDNVYKIAS